jgi:hypothetical protein
MPADMWCLLLLLLLLVLVQDHLLCHTRTPALHG